MVPKGFLIVHSVVTLALWIITVALASTDKRGVRFNNIIVANPNILASFGLIGSILGLLVSLFAFLIIGMSWWNRTLIALWIFWSAIALWWSTGALGMWIYIFQTTLAPSSWPSIFIAEFAFEVISTIFHIILATVMVRSLRSRPLSTK